MVVKKDAEFFLGAIQQDAEFGLRHRRGFDRNGQPVPGTLSGAETRYFEGDGFDAAMARIKA